jgi:hypothetical protein
MAALHHGLNKVYVCERLGPLLSSQTLLHQWSTLPIMSVSLAEIGWSLCLLLELGELIN